MNTWRIVKQVKKDKQDSETYLNTKLNSQQTMKYIDADETLQSDISYIKNELNNINVRLNSLIELITSSENILIKTKET